MASEIRVQYFAVLKECSKVSEEVVKLLPGDTGAAVYLRLAEKYRFPLELNEIRVAVQDEFAPLDRELCHGENVIFIPPVAGG